jgi:hypothetical protein
MKIDGEKALLDSLCTKSPQDMHKVLTDSASLESIAIWWRFGKANHKNDQKWLQRQVRAGDYSTLGLMCLIAAFQGARGKTLSECQHQFDIIDEEACIAAGLNPRTRRRKGGDEPKHTGVFIRRESDDELPPLITAASVAAKIERRHD